MTDGVGLVFVTLDEAEVLCESRDPVVVGARLTATYSEVVVKLGADGAMWCSRSQPTGVRVPAAPPAGPVVDTTGAGDAFAAAWLAARSGGQDPTAALTAADPGRSGRRDPVRRPAPGCGLTSAGAGRPSGRRGCA